MQQVNVAKHAAQQINSRVRELQRLEGRKQSSVTRRNGAIAYLDAHHVYELRIGGVPVENEDHEVMPGSVAKAINDGFLKEFQRISVEEFRAGVKFKDSKARLAKWFWIRDAETKEGT